MTAIYKDAGRPVHERVADLLARMTPEEKFAQMHRGVVARPFAERVAHVMLERRQQIALIAL